VREALKEFHKLGYKVVIFSCRNNSTIVGNKEVALNAIKEFMARYNLIYDEIDTGVNGKPYGDYYIDDRGIRFENNWNEIRDRILKENPTNER